MNRLTYFLQLMGNSKSHAGNKCNKCGCTPMIVNDFHFLASEFLGICNSRYCPSSEGIIEKTRFLKMVELFHPFVSFNANGLITLEMTSNREFDLCLKWIFEIEHKYETHDGNFIILTDITRPQWYEYLYRVQK